MDSKELAQLLNGYFEGVTSVVLRHGGMVDKFIGDAVFAIFNAPVDLPDHASHAVRCAMEIDDFCEDFRKKQNAAGIDLGITRVGVHTGVAVIGNFGSTSRFNYTAQGDAVNTAARLEGLNKKLGTRVCVSGDTKSRCPDMAFRPIASVVLKGKGKAVEVWQPLTRGRDSPGTARTLCCGLRQPAQRAGPGACTVRRVGPRIPRGSVRELPSAASQPGAQRR